MCSVCLEPWEAEILNIPIKCHIKEIIWKCDTETDSSITCWCATKLFLFSYKMCKSTGIWLQTKSWDKWVTACVCTDVLIFFEITQSFPTAYWPSFCRFQISPSKQSQSINGITADFSLLHTPPFKWIIFNIKWMHWSQDQHSCCNIYFWIIIFKTSNYFKQARKIQLSMMYPIWNSPNYAGVKRSDSCRCESQEVGVLRGHLQGWKVKVSEEACKIPSRMCS